MKVKINAIFEQWYYMYTKSYTTAQKRATATIETGFFFAVHHYKMIPQAAL